MVISFKLEEQYLSDFIHYNYWDSPRKKVFRILNRTSFPLLIIAFFIYQIMDLEGEKRTESIYYFLIGGGALIGLYQVFVKKLVIGRTEKQIFKAIQTAYTNYFDQLTISLKDKHIMLEHNEFTTKVPWTDITRMEITQLYYFLYQADETALIIPKSKVSSNVEFLKLIDKKLVD